MLRFPNPTWGPMTDVQQAVHVVVGQATAEPGETLRDFLVNQLADGVPQIRIFRGMSLSPADVVPEDARIRMRSTGLLGSNLEIWRRGQLDVIPERVSRIPSMLRSGELPNDVVLVRAVRTDKGFSTGVVNDYLEAALESTVEVVVQVTPGLPVLPGAPTVEPTLIRTVVEAGIEGSGPPQLPAREPQTREIVLAERLASLVRDGDCVQIGLGGLGTAICRALARTRRQLGVHTGLVDDAVLDLIDSGAVTNQYKAVEPGRTVTPLAMGSADFYRRLASRDDLVLKPVDFTNDAVTIAGIDRFVAINGALQVDLLGQVNAEVVGGTRISTAGGQMDFFTGARMSRDGRAVTVIRSTTRDGSSSCIVPRIDDAVVTAPAGFVDFVVTEYGVAELRGATFEQRARRLIAIAHPRFRPSLTSALNADARVHQEATWLATLRGEVIL